MQVLQCKICLKNSIKDTISSSVDVACAIDQKNEYVKVINFKSRQQNIKYFVFTNAAFYILTNYWQLIRYDEQ